VFLALVAPGCDSGDGASTATETQPPTTTDETSPATASLAVYLVREGKIAPVRRSMEATPAVARAALEALLEGPTAEERADGLATAIPDGTALLDVAIADGVASVDLSGTFDDAAAGGPVEQRVAQVVATLTRFPTVDRVRFEVDGKPIQSIDGTTVDPPVGRLAIEESTPQILVESPLPGDTVTSPIALRGTANVFEATVSIEVRDATGKVILETFTTATSGTGTRGTFGTELDVPSDAGPITVVAFEASAEDGSPLHVVELPLRLAR
jgi:hypothetical protein